MPLTCPYRVSLAEEWSLCKLAERETAAGCGAVHLDLCTECEKDGSKRLDVPNPWLASAVLSAAHDAFKAGLIDKEAGAKIEKRLTPFLSEDTSGQPQRTAPCYHLGRIVQKSGCSGCNGTDLRQCQNFKDGDGNKLVVTQLGQCQICPAYVALEGP